MTCTSAPPQITNIYYLTVNNAVPVKYSIANLGVSSLSLFISIVTAIAAIIVYRRTYPITVLLRLKLYKELVVPLLWTYLPELLEQPVAERPAVQQPEAGRSGGGGGPSAMDANRRATEKRNETLRENLGTTGRNVDQ